jgi:hypothetical protein
MNMAEGARRMRLAALPLFILCLGAAYLGLSLIPELPSSIGVLLAYAVILPGAILWLAGWILQGFARPK